MALLSCACGPGDEASLGPAGEPGAEAAPEEGGAPVEAGPEGSAPLALSALHDFRRPAAADGFAHDPHVEVGCVTCHPSPRGHRTHREVACGDCHDAPAVLDVPPEADCMGCHHDASRGDECTRCHGGHAELPGARVAAVVDVAGVRDDLRRELPFEHDVHRAVDCTRCHRSPATLAVEDGLCATCHDDHHVPEAGCLSCHAPLPLDTHDAAAHGGCAGTGCHADAAVLALPPTRSFCLACHQDQVRHEPARECAPCHQTGPTAVPGGRP